MCGGGRGGKAIAPLIGRASVSVSPFLTLKVIIAFDPAPVSPRSSKKQKICIQITFRIVKDLYTDYDSDAASCKLSSMGNCAADEILLRCPLPCISKQSLQVIEQ